MKRIFIIPILAFISFLILFYFILPQAEAFSRAKRDFLKREQDVKNRQEYFEGLRQTLNEVSIYQETLDKIEKSMPGEVSLSSLIGFFNQKAENNGLTLKSVSPYQSVTLPEGPENSEQIPFQTFSLSLSGGISSFENFLKDIGSSLRLVDVESFSLQSEGKEESSEEASFNINAQVKVYY